MPRVRSVWAIVVRTTTPLFNRVTLENIGRRHPDAYIIHIVRSATFCVVSVKGFPRRPVLYCAGAVARVSYTPHF